MPIIKLSQLVNKDRKKVYGIIKNSGKFPEFMKNVKRVDTRESGGNRHVTVWEVNVDNATVIWREEDIFDDDKCRIDFAMLDGDYARYEGSWEVRDHKRGSEISLTVNIEWGVPVLEEFIGNILKNKTTLSLKGMLVAIKKRAEATN